MEDTWYTTKVQRQHAVDLALRLAQNTVLTPSLEELYLLDRFVDGHIDWLELNEALDLMPRLTRQPVAQL